MPPFQITRRNFLTSAAVGASGLALSGCDAFDELSEPDNAVRNFVERANSVTYRVQRLLTNRNALAKEFSETDIHRRNGRTGVAAPERRDLQGASRQRFHDYRLTVVAGGKTASSRETLRRCLRADPPNLIVSKAGAASPDGRACRLLILTRQGETGGRFAVFHCLDSIERGLSGDIKYYNQSI